MKTYVHLWYVVEFFLEWEIFQTSVAEKIKTHILRLTTFSFENRAFFEVICKNAVQQDMPQMTIYYDARAMHVG
jgi:hypothetical protein